MNRSLQQSTKLRLAGTASEEGTLGQISDPVPALLDYNHTERDRHLRLSERLRERARIAHQLHDTLLQGFLGASMLLHDAVEQVPASSPGKSALDRALRLVHCALDEGRAALCGLRLQEVTSTSLEQALSDLGNEFTSQECARVRIYSLGQSKALKPAIREEIYLIAREAVVNALRHSGATAVEVEIEYLRSRLRVVVRDNGKGFDYQLVRPAQASHWGLQGMRKRAREIGAQFRIWSKPGAGTEIEISMDGDLLEAASPCVSEFSNLQREAVS